MESIIVYGSCYGSAEKYAAELSVRTGIRAESFKTAVIPAEWHEKAEIFHLRGGIDYSCLHFLHRLMMKLLYKNALKIPEEKRTAEVKAMIETYGAKVDFIDFSRLAAVCAALNG